MDNLIVLRTTKTEDDTYTKELINVTDEGGTQVYIEYENKNNLIQIAMVATTEDRNQAADDYSKKALLKDNFKQVSYQVYEEYLLVAMKHIARKNSLANLEVKIKEIE